MTQLAKILQTSNPPTPPAINNGRFLLMALQGRRCRELWFKKKTKIRTRSNHSLSSAFVLTVYTAVWRGFTCLLFCQERLKLLMQLFVPENCFNYCSLVSYQKLFRFSPRSAQCNMSITSFKMAPKW